MNEWSMHHNTLRPNKSCHWNRLEQMNFNLAMPWTESSESCIAMEMDFDKWTSIKQKIVNM